jgi:hypothetical protein
MKTFILNVDGRGSGLISLGTKEMIQDRFGYKPITARKWDSIKKVFDNIGDMVTRTVIDDIAGVQVENPEHVFEFKSPYDDMDAFVIDPVDGVFWALKKELLGDSISANQSMWDKLTNGSIQFYDKIGAMQVPVICTCHDRGEKRGDNDAIVPFVQGTFKDQLGSYFDVILYTKVYRMPNGTSQFKWQVVPDATRPARAPEKLYNYAKEKGSNGEIPQDFKALFANVEIANPKILIIGSYGTGKTHSLRTLYNVEFDKVKALPLM